MWEYTKKYARFIKLTRAKQDLLNPLLRNFRWKSQSPTLPEQEQSLTGGDVANKVGKSGIDGGEEDDRSPRFIASPSMLNVPPRLEFEDVQDANLKADNGDVVESVVIFVQ